MKLKKSGYYSAFQPSLAEYVREKYIKGWNKAVRYAYGWARDKGMD